MSAPGTLVIRRVIRASREDIFAMWIDAGSLQQWMTPGIDSRTTAELDPRVGGRYTIIMHGDRDFDHHGEYLIVDPPSKLSFTWISEGSQYQRSVVTVELFDQGPNRTELVLTHEQLPPAEVPRHTQGWTEIVDKLAAQSPSA